MGNKWEKIPVLIKAKQLVETSAIHLLDFFFFQFYHRFFPLKSLLPFLFILQENFNLRALKRIWLQAAVLLI